VRNQSRCSGPAAAGSGHCSTRSRYVTVTWIMIPAMITDVIPGWRPVPGSCSGSDQQHFEIRLSLADAAARRGPVLGGRAGCAGPGPGT
jgi:hypothetical protein